MPSESPARALLLTAVGLAALIIAGNAATWGFNQWWPANIMLCLVAALTYFGVLGAPGGWERGGGFAESRIRLAITSTFIMVYLVYFGTVIFTAGGGGGDSETVQVPELAENLIDTMTDLMMIVLPFYFGVSGLVEVAKARERTRADADDS